MKGIIIGGGIGGLTTAIALKQKGIDAKIYEQTNEMTPAGAGLFVASNALNVFHRLGMADEIVSAGKEFTKVDILDTKNNVISSIDCEYVKRKFGKGNFSIHRGELQRILIEKLPPTCLITGKVFEKYNQDENEVEVYFTDGTVEKADFLIAADGIHSKARKQMFPNQNLRFANQTCWRFVTNFTLPNPKYAQEIWANEKGLRVGFSQINQHQVYCYITIKESKGGKDDQNNIKEKLLSLCSDFQPFVKEIVQNLNPKEVLRNDIYDFSPISNWQDKKVILLGDAAHATTPNLGQGACQAIEDAYVIADCLAKAKNVESAFNQYQNIRIKKAHYITNTSWLLGKVSNTSGFLKKIVMFLMASTPKSINQKQFDMIYQLNF